LEGDDMSVATEFPPIVYIPEQARRAAAVSPTGRSSARVLDRGHLRVVLLQEVQLGEVQFGDQRLRPARLRQSQLRQSPLRDLSRGERPAVLVAAAPLQAPRTVPVRLTRRGYLAAALLVLIVAASLLMLAHASAGATPRANPMVPSVVTVHQGDTLWSIARSVAPRRDPRAGVDQLMSVNHLSGAALTPGQILRVS
jgi:nucleoid-associated protein YgaU